MPLKNYRRCISCRSIATKESFWRIVRVFPSGTVQLDQGMGRSAYLCPSVDCLKTAQKKNRIGRSLKTAVPEEIYRVLWQRLSATQENIKTSTRAQTLPLAQVSKQMGL